MKRDLFGLGWRPELAAGIFESMDRIDVVEVIADDLFDAPAKEIRAVKTLATQLPVVLHGIQLGLASSAAADEIRLSRMAKVVDQIRPDFWSEHLAFVRGGGVEIGHLAAPPRNEATIVGAACNVETARKIVGARPLLENIATLIDPPASDRSELEWILDILNAAECDLLLDLHNLHANAVNFGFDASGFITALPAGRIAAIHIAGGRWIRGSAGGSRLLDDHFHDVPDAVYELLAVVGRHASRPLTVILERDGSYPPMESLIAQLDRARSVLADAKRKRDSAQHQETPSHVVACV
jgi:uncharacterized protein (UPF0276 family)